MERNNRKVYTGKVVSTKEDKTIKVLVTTYRKHPLYGKRVEIVRNLLPTMKQMMLKWEISLRLRKLVHYQKLRTSV